MKNGFARESGNTSPVLVKGYVPETLVWGKGTSSKEDKNEKKKKSK